MKYRALCYNVLNHAYSYSHSCLSVEIYRRCASRSRTRIGNASALDACPGFRFEIRVRSTPTSDSDWKYWVGLEMPVRSSRTGIGNVGCARRLPSDSDWKCKCARHLPRTQINLERRGAPVACLGFGLEIRLGLGLIGNTGYARWPGAHATPDYLRCSVVTTHHTAASDSNWKYGCAHRLLRTRIVNSCACCLARTGIVAGLGVGLEMRDLCRWTLCWHHCTGAKKQNGIEVHQLSLIECLRTSICDFMRNLIKTSHN